MLRLMTKDCKALMVHRTKCIGCFLEPAGKDYSLSSDAMS
jgi:hypothetical protein